MPKLNLKRTPFSFLVLCLFSPIIFTDCVRGLKDFAVWAGAGCACSAATAARRKGRKND